DCDGRGYRPTPLDAGNGTARWAATPCNACGETGRVQPVVAAVADRDPWTVPISESESGIVPALGSPALVVDLGERARRADGLKATIDAAVERLAERLAAGHSAEFLRVMAFYARFHKYSWNNALLILAQCPHATRVAGMRTWNELNYSVSKG